MSMNSQIENAAKKMSELVKRDIVNKLQGANEAKTRLLIVDEVLSILGWLKTEYEPEQATAEGNGYTDYRLTIDSQPRLIVEAKRLGRLQPLPKAIQSPQYTNSFLYNHCGSEMKSLLDQCTRYCISCGLPYALATTGEIWIVLLGFKYGADWGNLKAFVFHSLDDALSRFSEFYGLISREAVKNNSLEEKFGGMFITKPPTAIRPREYVTLSSDIGSVPHRQTIRAFFDHFMADITRPDQEKMLQQCYVDNHELNEFSRELQQILQYDSKLEEADITREDATESNLEKELEFQSFSSNPKTILLVGNVGAGKSTFVHRFIRYEARPKQHICTLIDLINESTKSIVPDRAEEQRISELVLEKLIAQLKKDPQFEEKLDPYSHFVLRICFEDKLSRFKKQRQKLFNEDRKQYDLEEEEHLYKLSEDTYDHLVRYIRYIRKKRHKVWIAFDNVDRGSYSYQQFIYAFAHRLADDAHCVTLLTLRQDTFLEAQEAGFLDVRRTDTVFQLHAPEFRQVVSKRRKYIEKVTESNEIPKQFKADLQLVRLLNSHLKLLVLDENHFIRLLITTFSLNNVRYALAMLSDYYTSPHSTFHEFYQIHQNDSTFDQMVKLNYEMEQNRFLQALMLKNSWSYEEKKSDIFNLFSVDPLEKVSHFLMLRILAYLNLKLSSTSSKHSIKYEKLYSDFISLGYQSHHINNATLRLLSADLIISPSLPADAEFLDPLPQETKIALSAKGYYYLQSLASPNYYQARVAEDTVWYNEELAKRYIECLQEAADTQGPGADDTLQATDAREIFIKYLRSSLLEEAQSSNVRHTSKDWAQFMNSLVEEKVFKEAVTKSVQSSKVEEKEVEELLDNFYSSFQETSKKRTEKVSLEQMHLFEEESVDYKRAIQEAVASLGSMPKVLKTNERSYALRVLWALEVAFRAGLGPLRPKEITTIIRNYGEDFVMAGRITAFLQHQKRHDGEYRHLWREEPNGSYTINSFGQNLLEAEIRDGEINSNNP